MLYSFLEGNHNYHQHTMVFYAAMLGVMSDGVCLPSTTTT